MKTSDIKKIGFVTVDHCLYHGDYNRMVIELRFCGIKFYELYNLKSFMGYSRRLAMYRIFSNIKRIAKGIILDGMNKYQKQNG